MSNLSNRNLSKPVRYGTCCHLSGACASDFIDPSTPLPCFRDNYFPLLTSWSFRGSGSSEKLAGANRAIQLG